MQGWAEREGGRERASRNLFFGLQSHQSREESPPSTTCSCTRSVPAPSSPRAVGRRGCRSPGTAPTCSSSTAAVAFVVCCRPPPPQPFCGGGRRRRLPHIRPTVFRFCCRRCCCCCCHCCLIGGRIFRRILPHSSANGLCKLGRGEGARKEPSCSENCRISTICFYNSQKAKTLHTPTNAILRSPSRITKTARQRLTLV